MDAERPGDAVSDAALDRELQSILAVDPSPALTAGVRARIAEEPEPHAWWLFWRLAIAFAAAVVVVAVFVARPRERTATPTRASIATQQSPAVGRTTPGRADNQTFVRAQPQPSSNQEPGNQRAARRRGTTRAVEATLATATAAPDADIVIDARESAALRALIAGVRAGRVDLERALHASAPAPVELPALTTIAIAPITIEPLVSEEGVRQ